MKKLATITLALTTVLSVQHNTPVATQPPARPAPLSVATCKLEDQVFDYQKMQSIVCPQYSILLHEDNLPKQEPDSYGSRKDKPYHAPFEVQP